MNAPMPQSLSKIFVVEVQSCLSGRVQVSADANGRIQEEAGEIIGGCFELSLQGVIDHDGRLAEILEKIADARAHRLRNSAHVSACYRLGDRTIEPVIELVHAAIP